MNNTTENYPYENQAEHARSIEYALGNPELPIANFREQIVDAVDASQAVVITAETGAGKSTQVPQFLAEAGYEVIVTQPRIVAARSVAERVQEEIVSARGEQYADFVGYRTARERGDNKDNQILFVTDGLQTVRELAGQGVGKKQVLVLDEVHEWNENMEVLVAWAKKRMAEDPDFKVVTMSATMEADKLSEFFALDEKNDNIRDVPVIEVPGRTFEVDKKEGGDVASETIRLAKEGKNTLVFVPGKAEIQQVISQLEQANIPDATILALHGQLDKEEQRKVFKQYLGVKVIVATNVAQTSITINDIDAVVDSGLERTNEVKNGVEGLYLRPISQADCMQRAGRAGRTKEGEYVLGQLGSHTFVPLADRHEYGTPEIMRSRLDGTVLRLASSGLDASELEFYHQPDPGEIVDAKERLKKLGALSEDGQVTKVGRQMERMPVESHYARMMIEARQYSEEVRLQLAAVLAVQEIGGITFDGRGSEQKWRQFVSDGTASDMLAQLDVFIAAQSLSSHESREYDIIGKNLGRSREVLRQLLHAEKLSCDDIAAPSAEERDQLVKCIIAGMVDHVYTRSYGSEYINGDSNPRQLSNRSMVQGAKMVVGNPFDLQVTTRRGPMTLRLIESATVVPSIEILQEVAPQLFKLVPKEFFLNSDGRVIERCEAYFNGSPMGQMLERNAEATPERLGWLVKQAYAKSSLPNLVAELKQLQGLTLERLPAFTKEDAMDWLASEISYETETMQDALSQIPELSIDYFVSKEMIDRIADASPKTFAGYDVSYVGGLPYIGVTDDEVIGWEHPVNLPDGREIHLEMIGFSIRGSIASRKAYLLEQQELERAAEERKLEERRVAEQRAAEELKSKEEAIRKEQFRLEDAQPIIDYFTESPSKKVNWETVYDNATSLVSRSSVKTVLAVFEEVYDAPYGKARRLARLTEVFGEDSFPDYMSASSQATHLAAAIRWLRKKQAEDKTVSSDQAEQRARTESNEPASAEELEQLMCFYNQ